MGDEPTLYEDDIGVNGWVEALQQALLDAGHDPQGIDGKFKSNTLHAVIAFQRAKKLTVDGRVGNQTWAALRGRDPESPGVNNAPYGGAHSEPKHTQSDAEPKRTPGAVGLERVGDGWHLTIEGFTEPGPLGVVLWDGGPPSQVTIALLVAVTEPAQIGSFEITGLDSAAFDAMDPQYAKWFWDMGWRPQDKPREGNPLHTVRIWIKSFIPQALLSGPPGYACFLGDNRGFSDARDAPARMHSEVLLQGLHTATPTMTEEHWTGLTTMVDCSSERLIESGHAETSGMRFYNFRYPGADVWDWNQAHPPPANPGTITMPATAPVSIDYLGAAADPLVPVAPFVDMWAHIELDLHTGILTINGAADDYPAFEAYVLVNEQHGPFTLMALDGDDAVLSLVGGANRTFEQSLSLGSYVASE